MISGRSIRLAQFYNLRMKPLLNDFSSQRVETRLLAARFYEAVGWLIQGVFCGYFEPAETRNVLSGLEVLRASLGDPDPSLFASNFAAEVDRLYRSDDPFPARRQMQDGPQRRFELPIFPHILEMADRWDSDPVAAVCTSFFHLGGKQPSLNFKAWHSEDLQQISQILTGTAKPDAKLTAVLAGFLRTLGHMENSRRLFLSARTKLVRGVDFNSFCERMGSLNSWRVPYHLPLMGDRFRELSDLLEFAIRLAIKNELPGAVWSELEAPIEKYLAALVNAWEGDHMQAMLAEA